MHFKELGSEIELGRNYKGILKMWGVVLKGV